MFYEKVSRFLLTFVFLQWHGEEKNVILGEYAFCS